ncbi:Intradiol ring-cleavage dioxygenase [Xylariales sp. PMI_506]|nr:Intradiol ring-cleavage dioxygenase [Xylariales sp. PMI_506]
MARYLTVVALLAASLVSPAVAHPGVDIEAEIAERRAFIEGPHFRSLSTCSSAIKGRDHERISARMDKYDELRARRGLETLDRRSFLDVLKTNHHSNKTVGPDSTPEEVFGSNNSCILQPKVTEGPYYSDEAKLTLRICTKGVSGELVRQDITDDEPGVPLTFEVQLIDTTTCEPLSNVALEAWFCNSTGVYGGISARGNGNPNDPEIPYNTALRGIQFSDDDGIVTFDAIAPGHYTGRAVHIHIMAHIGATQLANGTIGGGHIAQVGQLFLDQSLNEEIALVAPYSTNTQPFTRNVQDGIMANEAGTSDPVLNYVYVGDDVSEGLFGWASVGLNPSASYSPHAAGHYNGAAPRK